MRELVRFTQGNMFGAMAMDISVGKEGVSYTGNPTFLIKNDRDTIQILDKTGGLKEEFSWSSGTISRDSLVGVFIRNNQVTLFENLWLDPNHKQRNAEVLESNVAHFFKGLKHRIGF